MDRGELQPGLRAGGSMTQETFAQQEKDADAIFKAITAGNFDNFEQAKLAIIRFWVPDMEVSRAGISRALERLERHYKGT
jgi:hypothetical protein